MSTTQTTAEAQALRCPSCAVKGGHVETVTLQALVRPELRGRITAGSYRFCDTLSCDTVYYDENGSHTFSKPDLTVRVGVKETDAPRPICYCFDLTIEEIEDEIRRTGQSTVLDDIKTRMKAGCWCETKSPQGACCLGTVSKYVKQALAQAGGGDALSSGEQDPFDDCCAVGALPFVPSSDDGSPPKSTGRAETVTQLGAVLAAIVASACCWLPLLLVALGVSGVAVSATLEQYRPIFLTVTFALLGAAFYFTYRRNAGSIRASVDESYCVPVSDGEAAEATCCLPGANKVMNLRRLNRGMLWIVTAFALAFAFFPNYVGLIMGGGNVASAEEQLPADAVAVTVAVEGMTCEACAVHVRSALEGLHRARSATVSFASNSARVVVDRDSVDLEAIRKAIESAGYKVRRIEQENE